MATVHRGGDDCPRPPRGTAVTIGSYDGVHRGHRAVIDAVRETAAARGLDSAVVTFDRHPATIVRPESAPLLLTDVEQEVELLAATGVDHVLVLEFDEARSKETAEEFVHEVLIGCLNARLVLVGEDFHFGHERKGDVALLRRMGADLGFEVVGLELVGAEGAPAIEPGDRVSSTSIRTALSEGDLDTANHLLGRPHEVRGVVVEGDRRGREWGFATANIQVPDNLQLPADGIYAVWYRRPDGSVHPGAANLGRRPTIYEHQPYRLLEVHLLDGDDYDLYGERAAVQFVERLRPEIKYETVDELVAQIARDVEACRRILGA